MVCEQCLDQISLKTKSAVNVSLGSYGYILFVVPNNGDMSLLFCIPEVERHLLAGDESSQLNSSAMGEKAGENGFSGFFSEKE